MSNRIYKTDKVNDIIGFKEKKYEKIDIYSERVNSNNLFGIAYYTEYKKEKPIQKQEIVTFGSFKSMIDFLKYNFDTYELDHTVRDDLRHIFFHYVDYCSVDYYLHDGKPDKNYIVLNYREYANGTFYPKSMPFPKEYEETFLNIVNRSKPEENNKLVFANTIDVNEKRKENIRENYRRYTVPMSEFIKISGEKLKHIKDNRKLVGKLKIVMAGTLLASILAGGYKLITDNLYNSEYLEQYNPIRSNTDLRIYANKGKAGIIIEKLMLKKYDQVTLDDLEFVLNFIDTIDNANYDQNDSLNVYDFDDYFDYLLLGSDNYLESKTILEKIEKMYKKIFILENNKIVINNEAAKEYIDFVSSLTFMYDTYHQTRTFTTVSVNSQTKYSKSATTKEIEVFDNYPEVLRLIILNQLKGVIDHVDYKVVNKPSYYFKDTDKYSLLNAIKDKINEVNDELYINCGRNYTGKV